MSDLRDLYQEYVLDHGKRPRNFGKKEGVTHHAEGYNPLCGDTIRVELVVEGDVIKDLGFTGHGCAISTASASTMTEAVKGMTLAEAHAAFEAFLAFVKGEREPDEDVDDRLAVFAGVAEFPMRVKCATLAWHTLGAAIDGGDRTVTTE